MGIETAALIVAGVAAGATAYNTYQTNKKTERATVAGIEAQRKREEQADANVQQTLAGLKGSGPEAEKAAAMDAYLSTARAGAPNANAGLTLAGAAGDRFAEDSEAASKGIMADALSKGALTASIDSARQQRVREGVDFANLGERLGAVKRGAASDNFLSDLRMKRAAQRDPWLDAIGSAGSAYASSGGSLPSFGPGVI